MSPADNKIKTLLAKKQTKRITKPTNMKEQRSISFTLAISQLRFFTVAASESRSFLRFILGEKKKNNISVIQAIGFGIKQSVILEKMCTRIETVTKENQRIIEKEIKAISHIFMEDDLQP